MKAKAYVVFQGRQLGVYNSWSECQQQVEAFRGNEYKGYPDRRSADIAWAEWKQNSQNSGASEHGNQPQAHRGSMSQWDYNPIHTSNLASAEWPLQPHSNKRSRPEPAFCESKDYSNKKSRKEEPTVTSMKRSRSEHFKNQASIIDLTGSDNDDAPFFKEMKPLPVLRKGDANIPPSRPLAQNLNKPSAVSITNYVNITQPDTNLPLAIEDQVPVTLTPEQEAVVQLAMKKKNIFLTGAAGSGKTATLLEILRRFKVKYPEKKRRKDKDDEEHPRVQVVAPTGIAALPLSGKTIYSFAGWKPDSFQQPMEELLSHIQKRVSESMQHLEVLIIEEISMVENQLLERLNLLMKHVLISDRPFGGKQVIMLGDFHQIPPVKPFQYCMGCGEAMKAPEIQPLCVKIDCQYHNVAFKPGDKWAFKSSVWKQLKLKHIRLEQIHRQKDSKFKDVLNKIRNGISLSNEEWDALTTQKEAPARMFPVRLMSRKRDVENFNRGQLNALPTPIVSWEAMDNSWKIHYSEADKIPCRAQQIQMELQKHRQEIETYHRFYSKLELKVGAKVVLLTNLNPKRGLVNGTQGEVMGFAETQGWSQTEGKKSKEKTRQDDSVQEFQKTRSSLCPVVRFANGQTMAVQPVAQESLRGSSQDRYGVCRTQIPLALAWALSIHKSQGMTLPCVEVSSQHIFERGQLYVALSRATCIEGLTVTGYSRDVMAVDENVLEFYQNTKWV